MNVFTKIDGIVSNGQAMRVHCNGMGKEGTVKDYIAIDGTSGTVNEGFRVL